jgi:hypothetical protein
MSIIAIAMVIARLSAPALDHAPAAQINRVGDSSVTEPEQAVIIQIPLSDQFGQAEEIKSIHEIEDRIGQLLAREKVGELDGDEFGGGNCVIYLYGQDANKIFIVITPILTNWHALKGGAVVRRYGPPGSQHNVTKY